MELTVWIDTLIAQSPRLVENLKANVFPREFLTQVFRLDPAAVDRLPQWLLYAVGIYFLCGLVTAVLRFTRGQKSLSSSAHQFSNIILTWASLFFIPVLVLLVKGCAQVLGSVPAFTGELQDLVRYAGQALASIFYPLMALASVGFTVWMPIRSFLRYLKVYQLFGLPHALFDIGFGPFLLALVLLSAAYGQRALYALAIPAITLLWIIQRGGYIPEERNVKAA